MGNLSKLRVYASKVEEVQNTKSRLLLSPGKKEKQVIIRFSDTSVFREMPDQHIVFTLFAINNKNVRREIKVTLSAPTGNQPGDTPELIFLSESTLRGAGCFLHWDITPYVRRHHCLPKELVVAYSGHTVHFWPDDNLYSFFVPRIEVSGPAKRQELSHAQAELLAILGRGDYQGVILYPPTIDWNVPLFQRPQQLMKFFAEQKYLCFFLTANRRFDDYADGFHRINDYLYISHAAMDTFSVVPAPIVILSWAMNISYLQSLENYFLVYDYIDDVSIFHLYDQRMEAAHRYLLQHADVVVATADRLLKKAKKLRTDAVLCPNGVDFTLFSRKQMPPRVPLELRAVLGSGKQIVGYYGALADWVDYGLIRFLAEKRPDIEIVLIGMDYDGSLGNSGITQLINVTFLGPKPYSVLPDYLACFDVAVIPFCINEITLGTNPIKMYEYMCAGKPVVTTNMPECVKAPGVLVGKNKKQFVRLVDKALQLKNDGNYVQSLVAYAKRNTWDSRVKVIRQQIEKKWRRAPSSQ